MSYLSWNLRKHWFNPSISNTLVQINTFNPNQPVNKAPKTTSQTPLTQRTSRFLRTRIGCKFTPLGRTGYRSTSTGDLPASPIACNSVNIYKTKNTRSKNHTLSRFRTKKNKHTLPRTALSLSLANKWNEPKKTKNDEIVQVGELLVMLDLGGGRPLKGPSRWVPALARGFRQCQLTLPWGNSTPKNNLFWNVVLPRRGPIWHDRTDRRRCGAPFCDDTRGGLVCKTQRWPGTVIGGEQWSGFGRGTSGASSVCDLWGGSVEFVGWGELVGFWSGPKRRTEEPSRSARHLLTPKNKSMWC